MLKSNPVGRSSLSLVLALAFAALVSACGESSTGSDKGAAAGDTGTGGSGASSGVAATGGSGGSNGEGADCAKRPSETIVLNKTITHDGFEIALGTAVLLPETASCAPGSVTIDVTFTNRALDTGTYNGEVMLTSGGKDYPWSSQSTTPSVPGKRFAKGNLLFSVDKEFKLSTATLLLGSAGEHHASVPLGKDSPDAFVSLAQQPVPFPGTYTAGAYDFKLTNAFLRADQPRNHDTLPLKQYEFVVEYAVTKAHAFANYGDIDRPNFTLKLPDGTSAPADGVSCTRPWTLGTTTSDCWTRFLYTGPSEGAFVMTLSGEWAGTSVPVTVDAPFVVPHSGAFEQ